MADEWPKISARRTTTISPWMEVIAREVEFAPGEPAADLSRGRPGRLSSPSSRVTPDGRIPIVRQYRPALEAFTWELPAGLVETGEDAGGSCSRELLEETGYPARKVHPLGAPRGLHRAAEQPGAFVFRRDRRASAGFHAGARHDGRAESRRPNLCAMIKAGEFVQQLHLGALMLARLHSFLDLPIA